MKNLFILTAFVLLLMGCYSPKKLSKVPLSKYDKHTEYGIRDRPDGFEVTVFYSRYQFIGEGSLVRDESKSKAIAIAYEVAEERGKKIKPINEQRIKLTNGRNELSGVTSCLAVAIVEWE